MLFRQIRAAAEKQSVLFSLGSTELRVVPRMSQVKEEIPKMPLRQDVRVLDPSRFKSEIGTDLEGRTQESQSV